MLCKDIVFFRTEGGRFSVGRKFSSYPTLATSCGSQESQRLNFKYINVKKVGKRNHTEGRPSAREEKRTEGGPSAREENWNFIPE